MLMISDHSCLFQHLHPQIHNCFATRNPNSQGGGLAPATLWEHVLALRWHLGWDDTAQVLRGQDSRGGHQPKASQLGPRPCDDTAVIGSAPSSLLPHGLVSGRPVLGPGPLPLKLVPSQSKSKECAIREPRRPHSLSPKGLSCVKKPKIMTGLVLAGSPGVLWPRWPQSMQMSSSRGRDACRVTASGVQVSCYRA